MSDAASGKICVVCGVSCEDRPRVKDPKGRYFCRECYDKALERKRKKRSDEGARSGSGGEKGLGASGTHQSGSSGTSAPQPIPVDPSGEAADDAPDLQKPLTDDFDFDHDPSEDSDHEGDDAAAGTAAGTCPNCGAEFPLAAVICVNCGYNTTTGHTVEAKTGGTVVAKEDVPSDTIWPSVIGVLAIVIGVGLAGMTAWGIVELLLGGAEAAEIEGIEIDPTWGMVIPSILAVPFTLIMVWHAFAGIGLIQRREWGYRQMALWAKAIVAGVGVVFILGAGLLIVAGFLGGAVLPMLAAVMVLAVGAGIFLAWPIFLLLWLNRDRIEEEVDEWE